MASRSRSRSPLRQHGSLPGSGRASPTPSNVSASSSTSIISLKDFRKKAMFNAGKFHLKLTNVPLYWKWHNVSGYIKKHTLEVDKAIAEDMTYIHLKPGLHPNTQESIVVFKSDYRRNQAFDKLKRTFEKVDGKKLFVTKSGGIEGKFQKPNYTAPKNTGPIAKFPQGQKPKPNYAASTTVDTETYGLSTDYLRELEIVPPLTRKVFVRSLPEQYNDEAKARSLFSLAGTVVSLVILSKPTHTNARIEYDHPVEAVQAVSMFNNRELFGKPIKVVMDSMTKVWTDGMPVQGPGLGPNGTPMRGVRVAVEIKKAKTEIMNEFQRLCESVDELKAQLTNLMHTSNSTKQLTANIQNAPNPLLNVANPIANPIAANPLAALGNLITNQLQPVQLLQSLVQQNAGNDLGLLGNALQTLTGTNLSNMLQQAQSTNQSRDSNMQGVGNMQGGSNMQGVSNMQGGSNMQSVPSNMQSGPSNMQSGPNNMQSGPNNMHSGPNNMHSGQNNMQGVPNNMQSGPNNMPRGPYTMQSGSANNMPSIPNNMQSGYYNMQSGPSSEIASNNMQSGPQNMQHGNPNAFGSMNNSFTPPKQQGSSNMHSGFNNNYNNMQPGSGPGPNQQINTGFGEPQFNNNNMGRQDVAESASTMLLFKNLPMSVTLPALQAKMHEVGEVKFIQMTGPGRALINFYSDHDADKCIRTFHQSKVDGQTIEVKKM